VGVILFLISLNSLYTVLQMPLLLYPGFFPIEDGSCSRYQLG
jgi:hypothetical protein